MMHMVWLRVGLLALVVAGCGTRANPHSCADGICNDQSLPFCDVDGTFGGEPNECIGVECTPGEVAACRGDTAVTCNPTGNNYDLISCEKRCESGKGCVECVADSECTNPEPICEGITRECRGCRLDSECPSGVCNLDTGACVATADVVYAIPNGSGPSPCDMAAPCPLARALMTALARTPPPPVRMLQGIYNEPLLVQTTKKLLIVATGATVQSTANPNVSVEGGGNIEIRDLILHAQNEGLTCGFLTPTSQTFLTLRRLTSSPDDGAGRLYLQRCTARIYDSEITGATPEMIHLDTRTELEIDRSKLRSLAVGGARLGNSGTQMAVKITNSTLENFTLPMNATDPAGGGTSTEYRFGFNTLVSMDLVCRQTPAGFQWAATFENNIFINVRLDPASQCIFNHNVSHPAVINMLTDMPVLLGGTNREVDPLLLNAVQRDYRLSPGSPAIDTAMPSAALPATTDLLGVTRPQGPKPDVGAYERKP